MKIGKRKKNKTIPATTQCVSDEEEEEEEKVKKGRTKTNVGSVGLKSKKTAYKL